jgi:hypothetical protein
MIAKFIILGLLVAIPNEFKVEIWNFIASRLNFMREIKSQEVTNVDFQDENEKLDNIQKIVDKLVKIDIPSITTKMVIDQMDETNIIKWLESKGWLITRK